MGRPPIGKGILIGLRLRPEDVKALDWWIEDHFHRMGGSEEKGHRRMNRPEAIRLMLQSRLEGAAIEMEKEAVKAAKLAKRQAKAAEMARRKARSKSYPVKTPPTDENA